MRVDNRSEVINLMYYNEKTALKENSFFKKTYCNIHYNIVLFQLEVEKKPT